MKIAVISDIHGNYPAFKQVIEDAIDNNVDRFILIGDYIFDMPFSNEVARDVMSLKNADIISGNKEKYLEWLRTDNQENWIFEQIGDFYQTFREMPSDIIDFLLTLKEEVYIQLDSGSIIYATHYLKGIEQQSKENSGSTKYHEKMLLKPFTHQEYLSEFSNMLKQGDWSSSINKINASVILFGHNHLQGYGYFDNKLIVNPGSCGLPLDFDNRASYTILEENGDTFNVIERRVEYDVEAVISTAKKSKIYECGKIWCELCFLALRTGREYFGIMLKIAHEIAEKKGEKGQFFSNETWKKAYDIFLHTQLGKDLIF